MWWFGRHRGIRRRCRRIVARLDLPDPFDLAELCDRAGQSRSRPIKLIPAPVSALGLSGLWLAGEHVDYIWYEENTSIPHREHVVLHELGHILCGHTQSEPAGDALTALFPQLDPAMVRLMLARRHDAYTSRQELEAEAFAYEVRVRVDRAARTRRSGGDDVSDRLGRALED